MDFFERYEIKLDFMTQSVFELIQTIKFNFKLRIMVNPDSPTFRFFEKVGYISGKLIKVIVIGGVVTFLGRKLTGLKPVQPQSPPPPPAAP